MTDVSAATEMVVTFTLRDKDGNVKAVEGRALTPEEIEALGGS